MPAPTERRNKPELLNVVEAVLTGASHSTSPSITNVPLLLTAPPPVPVTLPAVHTIAPSLTSVRAPNDFGSPLRVSVLLLPITVAPLPVIAPPLQVFVGPFSVIVPLPSRTPPLA